MKKSFFFRRLIRYFFYMLIPTIIVCGISFAMFLNTSDNELIQEGQRTVDSVLANFDLVVSDVLHQNELLSNSSRMSIALKKALNQKDLTYSDSIYLGSMQLALRSVVSAHSYIDSIYFYLDDSSYYFSSEGLENINISSDTSWFDIYKNMPDFKRTLIAKRQQNNLINSIQTISVFHRILLQKGCIVVNINVERFLRMLSTMRSNKDGIIYIFDEDFEELICDSLQNDNSEDSKKEFKSKKFKFSENILNEKNSTWMKIDGKKFLINFQKNEKQGFYVLSLISSNARDVFIIGALKTYFMIFILNTILILILSMLITKRSFAHIHYINQIFENAEHGIFTDYDETPIKDEYGMIMNNIVHLFVNTTYLNAQLKEKEYSIQVAELQALQLQINPHFLFNTLQSIELEIMHENISCKDEVCSIISSVSDILKYSLSDSHESVTLETEITFLRKYIEVQRARFGDRFIIYYELSPKLMKAEVFKLLLQPLVENSLLYGLADLDRKIYITITIRKFKDSLRFWIRDNGTGIPEEKLKVLLNDFNTNSTAHIGLKNVNKRLVLKYGEVSRLKIFSKKNEGTCIYFVIPFSLKK